MMDKDLELFIAACRKPGMFVQSRRYESVCAFIDGYDFALHGGSLTGFREWLLSEGSEWSNLPWWAIVRRNLFPNVDPSKPLTTDESDKLLSALATYLEGFLECYKSGGLEVLYQKYIKWLLARRDANTAIFRNQLH